MAQAQLNRPPYTPSAWGATFHRLPYQEALGAGAAGPGKTTVLLMDPLEQILVEHQRCADPEHEYTLRWGESTGWALHLRRTLKQLMQSMLKAKRVFMQIDPGFHWYQADSIGTFSSGYRFQFGHCKDPGDWENYFSSEYTHLAFDELVQFEQEQYDQLCTRVRSSDPVLSTMLKRRAMSNPLMRIDPNDSFTVSNPHWVRERFVDPFPTGKKVLVRRIETPDGIEEWKRIYLPATLADNPDPLFVKQYRITLRNSPVHIQEALEKGNWYFVPGAFFGEDWNERIHTCEPFRVPEDWPVFRTMDWGFKAFGCIHWWTMDPDGNLFVVRELTFRGKTAKEVAAIVQEIERDYGWWQGGKSLLSGVADPQIWEERGAGGPTMARVFYENGVPWIPADRTARRGSAMRLRERLRDHGNETKTPGIVFFKNCVKAIRTIPSIPTDPNDAEQPMDGGEDHWCDSIRYGCSFASKGRKGLAKVKRRRESWEDDDEKAPTRSGAGTYGSEVA